MTDKQITHTMPDHQDIVCIGDSITAGYWDEEGLGWPTRLRQHLARDYPVQWGVYNLAISGDTTLDCWHNLIRNVPHIVPGYLVIAIGTNDIAIAEGLEREEHRLSFAYRMEIWNRMLDFVKAAGWKTLVVGPIPAELDIVRYQDDWSKYRHTFRYETADVLAYNNTLEEFCADKKVPFLRVFEEWQSKISDDLFLDGLHPNAKGQALLANQVYARIKELGWLDPID